jgi:hypothetical protein
VDANDSSPLPEEWLRKIAKTGMCFSNEARAMAEEILRRREEDKKSQPGPEDFPGLNFP